MEKTIYYLGTCSTCNRIMKQLNVGSDWKLREIKTDAIKAGELDEMKEMAGSYEALFSRRAMKFRSLGLHEQDLAEKDYRKLILEEYTFLKRPVILIDEQIFIGNAKKTIEAAAELI